MFIDESREYAIVRVENVGRLGRVGVHDREEASDDAAGTLTGDMS